MDTHREIMAAVHHRNVTVLHHRSWNTNETLMKRVSIITLQTQSNRIK